MNHVYRFETKKDCNRREPEDYISMAVETVSNIASSLGKAAENFKVMSQISRIKREEKNVPSIKVLLSAMRREILMIT